MGSDEADGSAGIYDCWGAKALRSHLRRSTKGTVKLPNVEDARVDRTKIVDYLLALEHQEGAAKAAFFLRFGFTAKIFRDWSLPIR